jgi:hypothetical protein
MNLDLILDKEYRPWLSDLKLKVRIAQQAVSQLQSEQKVQQPVGQIQGADKSQQAVDQIGQQGIFHIFAEYALSGIHKPIGVSEYRLTESIPDSFTGSLPTIEQIEAELEGERE